MTVCEDKEGTDESSERVLPGVKEHVTGTIDPPTVSEGSTVLQLLIPSRACLVGRARRP